MRYFLLFLVILCTLGTSCAPQTRNTGISANHFVHLDKTVRFENRSGSGLAVASAFIIGTAHGSAYAVTAGHFCELEEGEQVLDFGATSPSGHRYEAKVVESYKEPDICFVRIKGLIAPAVKLSRQAPKHGDKVITLAAPFGLFNKGMVLVFSGYYSGVDARMNLATFTVPTRPGSSGAPVFNASGRLVGMLVAAYVPLEGIGFGLQYESLHNHIISFRRANKIYGS